jgi:hypothetical protein
MVMAKSIEHDPVYRTARLLSYRDQQCDDLALVMDVGAQMADDLARSAEAALADFERGSDAYAMLLTQATGLRGVAAHFRREVENVRRSWAIKCDQEARHDHA